MVAHGTLDQSGRIGTGQPVLRLADKFGLADETTDQSTTAGGQIIAGNLNGLAVLDQFAIGADAFQDRGPKARLMRATLGRGDGVAVGLDEAIHHRRPVHRPFHLTGQTEFLCEINGSGKGPVGIGDRLAHRFLQIIRQPAGKVKHSL